MARAGGIDDLLLDVLLGAFANLVGGSLDFVERLRFAGIVTPQPLLEIGQDAGDLFFSLWVVKAMFGHWLPPSGRLDTYSTKSRKMTP
jgi:hypothetical protein